MRQIYKDTYIQKILDIFSTKHFQNTFFKNLLSFFFNNVIIFVFINKIGKLGLE